ncbi:PD-(D/E)XK nuclease family protein [Streptomyces sp. G1]|uniref:PD-(D/E)XK nuclease family protein n=1 Tax=Streptomyces sp. G1 TaxID=361572 RepID=UPI00202EB780|nr:PD-(D/E)XK nuclease family protein [Streptomyces sp. G1]MCM1974997.1 PD-(D/E)XK nuclease family protein [Streptomyces sp. G1]
MSAEFRGADVPGQSFWASVADELEDDRAKGVWVPGPATALEVLGLRHLERHHQALIAWLLDPKGAHQLGARVLVGLLHRLGRAEAAAGVLSGSARVAKEVSRAQSRADIVVAMDTATLVIELKIHASEGPDQTGRLVADYASDPDPVFVFLTHRAADPGSEHFRAMRFPGFADVLRSALTAAPPPVDHNGVVGRATAENYLADVERMSGVASSNREAARFWLAHGQKMPEAQAAARALLAELPEATGRALEGLVPELPSRAVVTAFDYLAQGQTGKLPERAVLLSRPEWISAGGSPLAGFGLGQSLGSVDPFKEVQRPFAGVYVADPSAHKALRERWDSQPWDKWVWWEHLDLTPPARPDEPIDTYAARVAFRVRQWWDQDSGAVDKALREAGNS